MEALNQPPGRRLWRWLLAVGLLLALVMAGAGWWLSRWLDPERLVAMVSAEVLKQTGRQLHIDGGLSLRLWPLPGVRLEGVRLANAPGLQRPDMLVARSVVFEVALAPLLDRQVELRQVALSGVELALETDARGRGNWEFTPPAASRDASSAASSAASGAASAPAEPGAAPLTITLQHIDIDDSRLSWRAAGARAHVLEVQHLRVRRSASGTDAGAAVDAALRLNGQSLTLAGTTATLAAAGAGGERPVDLVLKTDGAELAVKGSVGDSTRLALRGKVSDAAGLLRASGQAPAWPAALRLPATFSADIEHKASLTRVSGLKVDGAGWSLSGQGSVDRSGRRPRLAATLSASALDLSAPTARPAAARPAAATPSTRLFSPEPWPALDLPDADGQLRFDIARLRLTPKLDLRALRGTLVLAPGSIRIDPFAFQAADGSVSGSLALKQPGGAAPPTLSIDAQAQGVTLEALSAIGGFDSLAGGRSNLRINLSGTARSAAAFAGSANGLVVLDAGPAQLRRAQGRSVLAQLADTVNPLTGTQGATELKCIAARLPFAAGVATFDRAVATQSTAFDLAASGRIDLGAETLDVSVMPSVRKAGTAVGPGLVPPVRLKGSLADPALAVDAKGTATAALAIGAAVASGGASVLGQRLLGSAADPQPCATALAGGKAAAAAPGGGKAPAAAASGGGNAPPAAAPGGGKAPSAPTPAIPSLPFPLPWKPR